LVVLVLGFHRIEDDEDEDEDRRGRRHHPMIQLNWQAIVTQAVALIVLVWMLKRLFFQKVLDVLDQRRHEVQDTFDKMESDRQAMESARTDYEKRLANIEAEAREHIQAAVKEAQQLREQLIADSRGQADALLKHAQEEIGREKQKALVELRTEVAELAVGAAT